MTNGKWRARRAIQDEASAGPRRPYCPGTTASPPRTTATLPSVAGQPTHAIHRTSGRSLVRSRGSWPSLTHPEIAPVQGAHDVPRRRRLRRRGLVRTSACAGSPTVMTVVANALPFAASDAFRVAAASAFSARSFWMDTPRVPLPPRTLPLLLMRRQSRAGPTGLRLRYRR